MKRNSHERNKFFSITFRDEKKFRVKSTLPLILLVFLSLASHAAPESEYWAFWDKSDSKSSARVDHASWDRLLTTYLSDSPAEEARLFNYGGVTDKDRRALAEYIKKLTAIDPRQYQKSEQMAYWINLYNALTVELVLRHYPVDSITDIGPWYKFGPWDNEVAEVAGEKLTLNDIEHRILRPIWQDKRIHYAVNCASLGCPDLGDRAFTSDNLEAMLEASAKRFINQTKAVAFIDGKLVLSRIYEWYASDFGSPAELRRHLKSYLPEPFTEKLLKHTGTVKYRYNWNLNETVSEDDASDGAPRKE